MILLFLLFVVLSPGVIFTLPVGKKNTLLTAVAHSLLFIVVYSMLRQSRHIEGFKTEVTATTPNGGYNAQKSTIVGITTAITAAQAAAAAAQNTLIKTKEHSEKGIATAQAALDAAQKEVTSKQDSLVTAQTNLAGYCCPTCDPPVPC